MKLLVPGQRGDESFVHVCPLSVDFANPE